MRTISNDLWTLWDEGGPFVGDAGAAHGRVTVEPDWYLTAVEGGVGSYAKTVRWWQRRDNSQTEVEIPSIKSIETDRSIDTSAATCTISLYNQRMNDNGDAQADEAELGNPGYYSPARGQSPDAYGRWGQVSNTWEDVLGPNALLRTYQGYGGRSKTIDQALNDGNIILTGVWLVDKCRVSTNGILTLQCRDMAKLLIEQPLYPPIVPTTGDPNTSYPHTLEWYRWSDVKVSTGLPDGTYGTPGTHGIVTGIERSESGEGYWIVGSDGGVFALGDAVFHGSLGNTVQLSPIVSIARTHTGDGYWLVAADGAVFAFGDAIYLGGANGYASGTVVEIEAHSSAMGYWIVTDNGSIYAYGAAQYYGGHLVGTVVGMATRPNNDGYWLVNSAGVIQMYGNAAFHGDASNLALAAPITGIEATPTGIGYVLVGEDGGAFAYGDGEFSGTMVGTVLNEPMCDIALNSSGSGYWLVAEDGGVFAFDVGFYGSLVHSDLTERTDGNYQDYTDIVKELLLWAGWYLYPEPSAQVYGNIESTGAYSPDQLAVALFDKKPVIDAINTIKEIVGYIFFIDDEGAVRFESPNFWGLGNFMEDGVHTDEIPDIDELVTLIDYTAETNDILGTSNIIVATDEPTANLTSTICATMVPADVAQLRGMSRPRLMAIKPTVTQREAQLMCEIIAIHIKFQKRFGSVTAVANPAIQINDQVRIYERQSGEGYVHYVRGLTTSMDLDSGAYTMTLTTHWLGL